MTDEKIERLKAGLRSDLNRLRRKGDPRLDPMPVSTLAKPVPTLAKTDQDTRANPCPDPRAARQPPWGW